MLYSFDFHKLSFRAGLGEGINNFVDWNARTLLLKIVTERVKKGKEKHQHAKFDTYTFVCPSEVTGNKLHSISYSDIYRELSGQADDWSKKALDISEGEMEITEDNAGVSSLAFLNSLYD